METINTKFRLPIIWYEIVAVSNEFMELLRDIPEASTASSVRIGEKLIEGPKQILVADSIEEIETNLPRIISQLADPEHTHVRIIEKQTHCPECVENRRKNPEKRIAPCSHNSQTLNRARDIDVKQYLTEATA